MISKSVSEEKWLRGKVIVAIWRRNLRIICLCITVLYGFGDASGTVLGVIFTCGSGFSYRIGVLGSNDSAQSSNWNEVTNSVESLEEEALTGNLDKSKVFFLTDNSSVELCSVKGLSTSPKLLELIIRPQRLTTTQVICIHIFHLAGARMISQGTDRVSRGFLGEGIMAGHPMQSFIPIHFSALDRSAQLGSWIKRCWASLSVICLEPCDLVWCDSQHWRRMDLRMGWLLLSLNSGYKINLRNLPMFAVDISVRTAEGQKQTPYVHSHILLCQTLLLVVDEVNVQDCWYCIWGSCWSILIAL